MNRRLKSLLFILFIFLSSYSHSQESLANSSILGLRLGPSFNTEIRSNYYADWKTILGYDLSAYLNIKRHDFSVGWMFPIKMYLTDGDAYGGGLFKIGALFGYRYYIFNPQHITNLFFQYEFQYVYFTGDNLKTYKNESYVDIDTYEFVHNIFGIGFSQFFDKNKHIGFSLGCGYVIPYVHIKTVGPKSSHAYSHKWLDDQQMNKCFNFYFNFNIKLATFKKKQKVTIANKPTAAAMPAKVIQSKRNASK